MKTLLALMLAPCVVSAVSWAGLLSKSSQLSGANLVVSEEDASVCVKHAKKFLHRPMKKALAIEHAVDHCALDKKVDDKNFVCPHYKEILVNAFARESPAQTFTAETFCSVAGTYVLALKTGAANIPNMGKGAGFNFKVSKECQPIVMQSIKPQSALVSASVPDFWYALCMNQDCGHFLPSRTRWCTEDHQPTHSAEVCEALRVYARDGVTAFDSEKLNAEEICMIYDEFVEDSHINVEAYLHVVHGKKKHPVPTPEDKKRALQSARMINKAGRHKLRDSAGDPVKSASSSISIVVGLVTSLIVYAS